MSQAEWIARELAEKHQARKVLAKLGNFTADELDDARDEFAEDLAEDEVPLYLKPRQALVTDRRLYTRSLDRPIPLADILIVGVERATFTERLAGASSQSRLVVNGNTVYSGHGDFEFLADLLTELSRTCRQQQGGRQSPHPEVFKDLARLAAASLCAGRSPHDTAELLVYAGMSEQDAAELVEELLDAKLDPKRHRGIVRFLAGLGLLIISIVGSVLTLMAARDVAFLFFGTAFIGLAFMVSGVWRFFIGEAPQKTGELLVAWKKQTGRK